MAHHKRHHQKQYQHDAKTDYNVKERIAERIHRRSDDLEVSIAVCAVVRSAECERNVVNGNEIYRSTRRISDYRL